MSYVEMGAQGTGRRSGGFARLGAAVLALAAVGVGHATALSDRAASLQPGEWAELSTSGFNNALLKDGDYNLFQYTEDIIWDPVGKQLLFVGGGHGTDAAFIVYDETTNAWLERPLLGSFWSSSFSHAYDHSTIIPSTRKFYHRQPGGGDRLEILDLNTQTWSRSAALPEGQQCCGAVEWFPELGRIVYVDGDYGVFGYNPSNDQWTKLSGTLGPMGPYHVFAEYSPVHKMLLFGGGNGSSAIYRMDSSGDITRISPDAPGEMGTTHAIVTLDPNSGNFLVFYGPSNWYEYDPSANSWSRMSGTAPFGGVFDTVATPVSTYGVVLFAHYNGDSSKVYLYRHSPGSGVKQPVVTLDANPTEVASGGSTELTWSASDAASCTASGGWTGPRPTGGGTEQSDPLTENTTFTLTCENGPNAETSRSIMVTVVGGTPAPTVTLTANPATVEKGGSTTLSWNSTNATSCTGSDGLPEWAGSKATMGSESVSPIDSETTFTLSCTGDGGTSDDSVTVSLTDAPTLSFTADPTTVTSGSRATLNWAATNATGCTASGDWSGNKATSGSEQTAALTTNSSFLLECSGSGGKVSRSLTVTVSASTEDPGSGDSGGGALDLWLLLALLTALTVIRMPRVSAADRR